MSYVIISVSNAYGQKGAYVARITGTDRKFGLAREFLAGLSPRITEPGMYEDCDVDRKGRKNKGFYIVVPDGGGNFVKVRASEDLIFAVLQSGRPVTDLQIRTRDDGKLSVRASDGGDEPNWRPAQPIPDDLRAEREHLAARIAEIDAILGVSP